MSKSIKSALILSLTMGITLPAVAQTAKFQGWSANLGLGYQSITPKFDNVIDNGTAVAVTASKASGLVGKVGLDYTWALNAQYVLSAGLDYGLNPGKYSELKNGATVLDRVKVKPGVGINLAPGILVDKNTLAYLKLGYLATTAKFESDGSTEPGHAYSYGLGAKFLQGKDYFVFTELNSLIGKKKSLTSDPATTGDIKGSGYLLSVGVGMRF